MSLLGITAVQYAAWELKNVAVQLTLLSTRDTAKIVRWYKKEGDFVQFKDLLCDIETEVCSLYSFQPCTA